MKTLLLRFIYLAFGAHLAWSQAEGDLSSATSQGTQLRALVQAGVDRDAWQTRLTDIDIDARELAFDELVVSARRSRRLAQALEAWSLDPTTPEFAWTARLALRELQHLAPPKRVAWIQLGAQGGVGALNPSPLLGAAAKASIRPVGTPLAGSRPSSLYLPRELGYPQAPTRHQFKMEFHPEGVVLTEFIVSGKQLKKVRYAAADSESLLVNFPQLRNQVPGLVSMLAKPFAAGSHLQWDREHLRFDSELAHQQVVRVQRTAKDPGRPRLVLGVVCTPVAPDSAAVARLGLGVGLLIERREAGTVAEDLGLQRGDILIELGGQPLCSAEEISHLLKQNTAQKIVIKILDSSLIERTLTWVPENKR
ncbi:MAG: hypothetical protein ACI8X5_001900 [Planctomycetota bacterium]|jgi:hypothetical protein